MNSEKLKTIMLSLVGEKVLKTNVAAGSFLSLEFGDQLTPSKDNEGVLLRGKHCLIIYCAWRLENSKSRIVLTGWHEDSQPNGVMTQITNTLIDDAVESIDLSDLFDLDIKFRSGRKLKVFCDLTPNITRSENWFFGNQEGYFSISNYFSLTFENRISPSPNHKLF